MKFIDENSLNRLNFKELLSRVDIFSAYGKNKLNNVQNFLVGEEEKLEKEFERMEKIYNLISNDKREMLKLEKTSLFFFKQEFKSAIAIS